MSMFYVKSNNLGWARIDHQAYMWTEGHGKQLLSWRLACSMVRLYLGLPSLLRPSAITAAEMLGWPESIGKLCLQANRPYLQLRQKSFELAVI